MHPLKNYLKYIIYTLRDLWLPKNNPIVEENTLCIIKMDAIGDYILFRNFIEAIATSSKYKDYEITLIGNTIWKELAEELDSKWINHFIWIDPRKFQKDFSYRKKCFEELQEVQYSVLIHPTFSRDYYVAETISKAVFAKQKIAATSDLMNTSKWQKRMADRQYSQFITIPDQLLFEFDKNRFFINSLLKTSSHINLNINDLIDVKNLNTKQPYCILFIGGTAEFRKWSLNNWIALLEHILSNYKEEIVIAGGPNDKVLADDLIQAFSGNSRISNLAGKTSLYQLIQLISGAKWMISNETSAPHMAAAVNTPVLVISNGNHYGRFIPYPKEVYDKYYTVFPKEIDTLSEEERIMKFTEGSDLSINLIAPKKVISALEKNFL